MTRVEGVGPTNPKIAIVGEAPGAEEVAEGVPFVGPSGKILNNCLDNSGLKRDDIYITNVVKVRPPDNKIKRIGELGLTLESFYPELYSELESINPNIVIAVGGVPLKALCDKDGILKWRGSILTDINHKYKVIPVVHPSWIMRGSWNYIYILTHDLKKAKREGETKGVKVKNRISRINPTIDEVVSTLVGLKGSEYISFDLETFKSQPVIRCIGLTNKSDTGFCVPIVKGFKPVWDRREEVEIWHLVKEVLTDKSTKLIAQNAQFEMTQLYHYVGELNIWMDTMRAHALLYPEYPHDLGFLSSIYTDMPYFKDEGEEGYDELQLYNCKDIMATFDVAMELKGELAEEGMWQ